MMKREVLKINYSKTRLSGEEVSSFINPSLHSFTVSPVSPICQDSQKKARQDGETWEENSTV